MIIIHLGDGQVSDLIISDELDKRSNGLAGY